MLIRTLRNPEERAEDDEDPLGFHKKMMQDPAVREHMENMFLDHWGQWVDTPLPILTGRLTGKRQNHTTGGKKSMH
jgi:hypothetical protein